MIKLNNSNKDSGHDLKKQVVRIDRTRARLSKGKIVALSPQGNKLYCIVRRPSKQRTEDGIPLTIKGELFGNEAGLSEEEVTLAEVLIESDLDLSTVFFDLKTLIGTDVYVELVDGSPRKVMIFPASPESRVISSRDIWAARSTNPERSLSHEKAVQSLKESGYSDDQINEVANETFSKAGANGNVLRYGDIATWQLVSAGSTEGKRVDSDISIITNLPKRTLGEKICHRPGLIFTGK